MTTNMPPYSAALIFLCGRVKNFTRQIVSVARNSTFNADHFRSIAAKIEVATDFPFMVTAVFPSHLF
jgi:hypothetical protein